MQYANLLYCDSSRRDYTNFETFVLILHYVANLSPQYIDLANLDCCCNTMGLLGMSTHCFLLRASPLALRSSSLCARSASLSSRVASRYATCCLRNSLRNCCRRWNNSSISERGQRVLISMNVLVYLLLIAPVKMPACSLSYIPRCKVAYLLLGCP